MIRLHQFKRQWGIANPSPFCMKVETYLRMTELAYEVIEEGSPLNAPKKKLPYINDGEKVIPDSGFIIDYLKASYGNPLDGGLSRAQQAEAHLLRRLCEESLLWPVVYSRWIDSSGWSVIKPAFFGAFPPVLRDAVPWLAQRRVKRMLWLQGVGRHRPEEIYRLGIEDLAVLAACLGDKSFFLGTAPTSIDAAAYASLANIIAPPIASPLKDYALSQENVVAYCERMRERYYGAV